ncbi:MAG: hypothetical protein LBP32_01305, partial [Spirochaetaceae bacterium]|nr:hypothetical protein [Spirochaetaceae bacterium]
MYPERLEYKKDALRIFDGRCRLLSAFVLIAAALTTTSYVILGGMIFFSVITLVREVRVTALRLVQVNAM